MDKQVEKMAINFKRMDWIIRLADTLDLSDRRWLVERLASDNYKREKASKVKKQRRLKRR